jgi:hypothetical protein
MKTKNQIKWARKPRAHDYPAAASYLSLIYAPKPVKKLVAKLRRAPLTQFFAKDVFRASRLPCLTSRNFHVRKFRAKIFRGHKISPILLVRDAPNSQVVIADGYHRMCAVYSFDEDADVPCKIV